MYSRMANGVKLADWETEFLILSNVEDTSFFFRPYIFKMIKRTKIDFLFFY